MAAQQVATAIDEGSSVVKTGDTLLTKARTYAGELLSDPKFWVMMAAPIVVMIFGAIIVWTLQNPDSVKQLLMDPNIVRDVVISAITVAILLFLYMRLLSPQIRVGELTRIAQKCPDRWSYDSKTGYCEPRYKTECQRFKSDLPELQSFASQCEFALKCGTNWAGVCE